MGTAEASERKDKAAADPRQKQFRTVVLVGTAVIVFILSALLVLFLTPARALIMSETEKQAVKVIQDVYKTIDKPKEFKLGEAYIWPVDLDKVAEEYRDDAAFVIVYFSYTSDTRSFGAAYEQIVCAVMPDGTFRYEDAEYYDVGNILDHMDPWAAITYVIDGSWSAEEMFSQRVESIKKGGTQVNINDIERLLKR